MLEISLYFLYPVPSFGPNFSSFKATRCKRYYFNRRLRAVPNDLFYAACNPARNAVSDKQSTHHAVH